jgi:zinc transporter ZupT
MLAFAAGGILAMLADTMFPEAFKDGGRGWHSPPRLASPAPSGLVTSLFERRRQSHTEPMPKEKKLRRKAIKVMVGTTVLTFATLVVGYRPLF